MNNTQVPPESAYSGPAQSGIQLIVYKEIKPGDLRKFQAESNDAPTGGGARDLRFRPHKEFDPIFARLLPTVNIKRGKSVRVGPIKWHDGNQGSSQLAEYWPPTDSRPGEGRWTTVNNFWPFQQKLPENEGRLVILLIQDSNADVWLRIETESELTSASWNQSVVEAIFNCINSQTQKNRSAQGYINFVNGKRFCNAG